MTKILDQAIARVRELKAEDQDTVGAVMLALADEALAGAGELDDETRAAIREGLSEARRGEFVADEEIAALHASGASRFA